MGAMILLSTVEEFEQAVTKNVFCFLLKHSSTCPISQAAFKEYEKFAQDHDEIPAYYLIVQKARPLSNYIAEHFQIKHESPQAILLKDDSAVWNASHWSISEASLTAALKTNQ